jgi:GTP cyclohydrolase IA
MAAEVMSWREKYEALVAEQLEMLGHDLTSDGMRGTAGRVTALADDYHRASEDAIALAVKELKVFDAPHNAGMVNVKNGFTSVCEHHLVPFFGTVQAIYLPDKQVTGLSKIYRALEVIAKRPQIQERITAQLADIIMHLEPVGVLVDVVAEHMCMRCRGIRDPLSVTRTRALRGAFVHDVELRSQALWMLM